MTPLTPSTQHLNQRQIALVISALIAAQLATGNAFAALPAGGPVDKTENREIFQEYCGQGIEAYSPTPPQVNYNHPEIKAAVAALAPVVEGSYWFYNPVIKAYGLRTATESFIEPPLTAGVKPTKWAHALLTQLCGEFRDRATLIRDKVRWYGKIYKTQFNKVQPPIPLAETNVWQHLTSKGYLDFLTFSSSLWEAKRAALVNAGKQYIPELKSSEGIDAGEEVDAPVAPQTVCETRYILTHFISNPEWQKKDPGTDATRLTVLMDELAVPATYATYLNGGDFKGVQVGGLKNYAAKYCAKPDAKGYTDAQYIYDYRGDKNFKHNSPEGNGMIWTATSIAGQCKNSVEEKNDNLAKQDFECEKYFSEPFYWRWNTARAAVTAWVFRDSKYDKVAENPDEKFYTLQHLHGDVEPLGFRVPGFEDALLFAGWTANKSSYYQRPDIGFNDVTGILSSSEEWNKKLAYKRLRDAVNRHTNWYASAFEDGMGWKMDQVYSPFVASSHVISASDGFAWGQNGTREWMFIHRVLATNVYTTQSVMDRTQVNFDTMWFDETSLGTTAGVFAKSERALDRLGTALEGEYEAILYLPDVKHDDVDVPIEEPVVETDGHDD